MDFKQRLAIAACAPNVSVSNLALEHEVNANMVFKWRRQYRAGLLGADVETTFLPVAVKIAPGGEPAPVSAEPSRPTFIWQKEQKYLQNATRCRQCYA